MLKRIYFLIATILITVLMLGSVNFVFAAGEKELTDDEKAAFIVRDEWTGWVRDFTASLSELDQIATAKIYDDMDFYDMQYRFTEKYKKVPEYLDEEGKPTQKLKDMIKEKRKKISGAKAYDFLCFTSKQNGSTVAYSVIGTVDTSNIGISYDGTSFTAWNGSAITLDSGKSIWVTNKNSTLSRGTNTDYFKFVLAGNIEASGSVESMVNFQPLSEYCFARMFYQQTALKKAPEITSTTMAPFCCTLMFSECNGLTEAPELPATALAGSCYYRMFFSSTGLTKGPSILPATKLAGNCYYEMFSGCSNLVEAPILPATTLATGCYSYIFSNCSSLNSITMNYPFKAMSDMDSYCRNWVEGVSETGTFYCNMPIDTYYYSVDRIPRDDAHHWTVVNSWVN